MAVKRKSTGRRKSTSSRRVSVLAKFIMLTLLLISGYLYYENIHLKRENKAQAKELRQKKRDARDLRKEVVRLGKALRTKEDDNRSEMMIRDIIQKNKKELK